MKTRYAILSALVAAAMLACGGGADQSNNAPKPAVFVETSDALTFADAASVTLTGIGAVTGAVGPFTLTYSATTGKYSGYITLAPDTYTLTLNVLNAASANIGTATATNVVVTASAVKTITFNVGSIAELPPPGGFLITASTASAVTIAADGAASATFGVTTAGVDPSFAWTAKKQGSSANCSGTLAAAGASATFTSSTTVEICDLTVTATAIANNKLTAKKVFTLGVGANVSVTGQFIPSPTIVAVTVADLDGGYSFPTTWNATYDPNADTTTYALNRPNFVAGCALTRSGTNSASLTDTCPGSYKVNTAIPLELFNELVTPDLDPLGVGSIVAAGVQRELRIGVTYDLHGTGSTSNLPKISSVTTCPTATGMVDEHTALAPMRGSAADSTGGTFITVREPSLVAAGELCTVTITVDNQGAIDTFPLKLFFIP